MIKTSLMFLRVAAVDLLRRKPSLVVVWSLYLLALLSLWLFATTREATLWQLVVTAVAGALAPLSALLLQAAIVEHAAGARRGVGALLRGALAFLPRMLLVSLPPILLGLLAAYLLHKLQTRINAGGAVEREAATAFGARRPQAFRWADVFLSTLRLLLLGVAAPLACIHLWLAARRRGAVRALREAAGVLRTAFGARALLIYTLGALLFGALPYFLIFTRTQVAHPWAELSIFLLRLLLASALALMGWTATIAALDRNAQTDADSEPFVQNAPDAGARTGASRTPADPQIAAHDHASLFAPENLERGRAAI